MVGVLEKNKQVKCSVGCFYQVEGICYHPDGPTIKLEWLAATLIEPDAYAVCDSIKHMTSFDREEEHLQIQQEALQDNIGSVPLWENDIRLWGFKYKGENIPVAWTDRILKKRGLRQWIKKPLM